MAFAFESAPGSKLPMHESSAALLLVGMFLAAMSPLLLLPLFLTDSQGRRRVGWRSGLLSFGVGVMAILVVFNTFQSHVVAPYAETVFKGMHSVYNVAKQLPGDFVEWLESGKGLYLLLKAFVAFAVIALFCARVLPILQKGISSLKAQVKGTDISLGPRTVNNRVRWGLFFSKPYFRPWESLPQKGLGEQREDIAASRERQQRELQVKAREKEELLRQRRLAHLSEQEQRLQRFGRGVGRYAR